MDIESTTKKDKKKYRLLKALRSGLSYAKQVKAAKAAEFEDDPTEAKRGIVELIGHDIAQLEAAYRENGGVL
jgi:hypothetical protein